MKDFNYTKFEDTHRGSSYSVCERLSIYKPILLEFVKYRKNSNLVDLGCGRGEFLRITSEMGIDSIGVDTNQETLNVPIELGLKVKQKDAIDFLKSQCKNSFDILTAFHFIEHLAPQSFLELVNEINRVLKPGGLLILETPNPENIIVSSCNFYTDITHVRPIPSELLKFIFSNSHFDLNNTWGLNSSLDKENQTITLIDILGGVSPDYAFLALKDSDEKIPKEVVERLKISRGITLNEVANLYEKRYVSDQVKNHNWTKSELARVDLRLDFESKKNQNQLDSIHSGMQDLYAEIQAEIRSVQKQNYYHQKALQEVVGSRSWRITYPLRLLGNIARNIKGQIKKFFFDLKNLPLKIFIRNFWVRLKRKMPRKIFGSILLDKLVNKKSFVSSDEKKTMSILEKVHKEK